MRTIHQKILAIFTAILIVMIAQPVTAQIARNEIPGLTEEQRTALGKLKDEHFIERHRMDDKIKQERREMRKRYDQKLRSILNEKQYYAFKDRKKGKGTNKNHRGRNSNCGCHHNCKNS